MENLIEFLNTNNGAITLIFSGVVALSTVVYAILTWRLVSETKRMRKVQTEPKLSIHIEPRKEWINFMDMIIENVGAGPALDIDLKINGDIQLLSDRNLSELNIFKNGINYLAPGQRIQFLCTDMEEGFDDKKNKELVIETKYNNWNKKKYTSSFTLDFSQYLGIYQVGNPPLEDIEKHLGRIQKEFSQLYSGTRKLKVDIYTENDRQQNLTRIKKIARKQEK